MVDMGICRRANHTEGCGGGGGDITTSTSFFLISFLCLPLVKANHTSEGKRSLDDKVYRELPRAQNK